MPKLIDSRPTLTKNTDYRRVYDNGTKLVGRYLILFVADRASDLCDEGNEPGSYPSSRSHRVGITVSSKVGGAVTRNLIRRRIKESLRVREAGGLVGRDSVFVAIRRITSASFDEIGREIDRLVGRVKSGPV
jgi:ribonuclease P protein component